MANTWGKSREAKVSAMSVISCRRVPRNETHSPRDYTPAANDSPHTFSNIAFERFIISRARPLHFERNEIPCPNRRR